MAIKFEFMHTQYDRYGEEQDHARVVNWQRINTDLSGAGKQ